MELLVAMGIALIVTGMLVMSWLVLTRSFSATARTTEAGELARDAISRLSREIRDAEPDPEGGEPALVDFGPLFVEFTTTFNQANNDQPLPTPVLTRYEYRRDATTHDPALQQTLHRMRDTSAPIGTLDSADRDDLVVSNLHNYVKTTSGSTVTWVEIAAPFLLLQLDDTTKKPVEATLPAYVSLVRVHLLVQMPGAKSPRPADLVSTVQLRNRPE
jgi:type II secretory pathway pseudopilin PulG